MNLKKLYMAGFTCHKETTVNFPNNGIVLITGNNGEGKSSLIEAVSWAMWGKTLRGTDPVKDKKKGCETEVFIDDLAISREKKSKVELYWVQENIKQIEWETVTKGQEALERIIGSWDVWKRTSVFSSADTFSFTQATDSERKRLLEEMLNLDKFDDAHEACKKDISAIRAPIDKLFNNCNILTVKLEELKKHQLSYKELLYEFKALSDEEEQALELSIASERKRELKLSAELSNYQDQIMKLKWVGYHDELKMGELEKQITSYTGLCPTCNQKIQEDPTSLWQSELEIIKVRQEELKVKKQQEGKQLTEKAKTIEIELEQIKEIISNKKANLASYRKNKEAYDRVVSSLKGLDLEISKHETTLEKAQKEKQKLQLELEKLEIVEKILGIKGVRSALLSKSLSGIEAIANQWLQKITQKDLSLTLLPYTEKKTGGVSESISLEIEGAGNGNGYYAASAGERRRINIALMLALSEVGHAAHGSQMGTLYLDECLDHLDLEGQEAMMNVIQDLARDRLVVFITHSEHLINNIKPVMHLHAENGGYSCV